MKFILIVLACFSFNAFASNESQTKESITEHKVNVVENRLNIIEEQVDRNSSAVRGLQGTIQNHASALFLLAFFCAWWAKSTGRNALLWFILGLLFHVFTAIALVIKTEPRTNLAK